MTRKIDTLSNQLHETKSNELKRCRHPLEKQISHQNLKAEDPAHQKTMQKNHPTSLLALQPLTEGVAVFTFSFRSIGGVSAMAAAWTGGTWRAAAAADHQGPRHKMNSLID